MSIFESFLALFAGCGVFIVGMNMMGDGMQRGAGAGLKKMLGKISGNRFSGVAVGAGVTAIIQSSAATTVMTIGFVNAGVLTLMQATAIIMGANIGTTVTGLIVSLSALNISLYASVLAFIGVMMMFIKKEIVKRIGGILCGLGLLFVGLDAVSASFKSSELKEVFAKLFAAIDFPLLLILVGAIFTGLIQSSSAATGLVIIMVGAGTITVDNALFIVLGSNIGTCVTAMLASIGTSVNARRTAIIHLAFNVIGTVLFTAFLWPFSKYMVKFLGSLLSNPQMQIAWFHVIFNVTTTLLLLPFMKYLVRLSEWVVHEKPETGEFVYRPKFIDDMLLQTPSVACMQTKKEVEYMAEVARENLSAACRDLCNREDKDAEEIHARERIVDGTNNFVARYLIKLGPLVSGKEEKTIGSLFHVINDLERVGDHAVNFLEITQEMEKENLAFSDEFAKEIEGMVQKVLEMFDVALSAFRNGKTDDLARLTELENVVDDIKDELTSRHHARLIAEKCKIENSAYFYSVINGLERVADHLVNVGYSTVNPTGTQVPVESL